MHPLLKDATEEQRAAIKHRDGPAFVSAAPGSGKTRVITYRCAYLLDQGVAPENIVGITFTNKAAGEMKSRVRKLVGQKLAKRVWLSTFHSFCVRLLRASPKTYQVHPRFGIADESDTKEHVTLAIAHIEGKTEKDIRAMDRSGDPGVDIKHVRRWISNHKNGMRMPQDLQAMKAAKKTVPYANFIPYYLEYNRILRKNGLLDFDDLLLYVVQGLRRSNEVCEFYAKHLHYLMVDEWQDTNFVQLEIARLLSKAHGNLFVVGDLEQSIYKFRGADPENTKRFYAAYPKVDTYLLQMNFRSVPGIALTANMVIGNNRREHKKDIIPFKNGGETPLCVEHQSPEHEAAYIIGTIKDLVRAHKADWKDFAVIYRIRSLSRAIEDEAVAQNIPYQVIGAKSFYNRAAVKDVLAYLRLVAFPHDNSAYVRIHNKPTRGIGAANFQKFASVADEADISLLQANLMGKYADNVGSVALLGFRKLKKMYVHLRGMDKNKIGPMIEYIIRWSGLEMYIDNMKDRDRRERIAQDMQELVSASYTFDSRKKRKGSKDGIFAFLDHVMLMQQEDRKEDDNLVTLMTAHAAKGLEFANVFLVGAIEEVLPLSPRGDDGGPVTDPEEIRQHYEEERRVFYVAITRAEERLWVTWPSARYFRGQLGLCEASRFIGEAGPTLEHRSTIEGTMRNPVANKRRHRPKPARPSTAVKPPTSKRQQTWSNRIPDGGAGDVINMRKNRNKDGAWELELERRKAVSPVEE